MAADRDVAPIGGQPTRAGAEADAIDQVTPGRVASPGTADGVAAALASASGEGQTVVVRGAGTKLTGGRPPRPIDVLLDLKPLSRIVVHRHGDLTVTLEGGAPIREVNRALAGHGQWLPCDSAHPDATIGGILATNDSGPLRHRFGTPRDLLIGVRLATTDGRLVRAGGQVVKNVAGYDLGRFVCGSWGTLAVVVEATFKLAPVLRAPATVAASFGTSAEAGAAVGRLMASQLDPVSVDVHARAGDGAPDVAARLLVRFASTPRATRAQLGRAGDCLQGSGRAELEGDEESAVWDEQVRGIWTRPGAIVRLGWRAASLPALLDWMARAARQHAIDLELAGRAAVGAGCLRLAAVPAVQADVIADLRRQAPAVGAVTVLRAERACKTLVDVWGDPSPGLRSLAALKEAFDPAGILGAGRGPV